MRTSDARSTTRSLTDYDVAIVGAGIVGLAVAREILFRRPELRLVIVDKEAGVAAHQTGHNSGVIHSGIYYTPGSLKARLCVEGSRLMYEYCARNGIAFEKCGKLIVALHESELPRLDELFKRGTANGVEGLRRITAEEIPEIEPLCRGIAALYSPNTGIVDYTGVCRSLESELRARGVDFLFDVQVSQVRREGGITVLRHDAGSISARWGVFCAGLWSDRLAVASGADDDPRIVPFRGAYLQLEAGQMPAVRGMVYPVPDPDLPFLGVHITKQIDGTIALGPTAMVVGARDAYRVTRLNLRDIRSTFLWPGTWVVGRRFWKTGISELRMAVSRKAFVRACAAYIPAIAGMSIRKEAGAGVRAQAVGRDGSLVDDFVISETPGATHVRNAPSPAATSAFALARELVDRFDDRLA